MSGSARALACPASAQLPQLGELPGSDSIARERGTAVHAFLQRAPGSEESRQAALARAPESHRALCEAIDLDGLPTSSEGWAREVTLAYDTRDDRAWEVSRDSTERAYAQVERPKGVIYGTADVIGLTDTHVVVPDYKVTERWLGRPYASAQLRGLALAAARAYGRDAALVGFGRVADSGEVWWWWDELSAFDLDMTAEALRELLETLDAEPAPILEPRPGTHCRYCPAFAACPAQALLVRELAREADAPGELPQLTAESAARAWARLKQVQMLSDRLEAHVKLFASAHPVPLGDGRVLGLTEGARETLSPDVAERVLSEMCGPEVAAAALKVRREAPKKRITEALRRWARAQSPVEGKRPAVSRLAEVVFERVRALGGAKRQTYSRVAEYTPGETEEEE